ncbi:phosphoribosylanthranilate isomerase [filamentous cyanobacterium CCP5]|nr:phosphoribosylanthranilate isomerase [filamentous cyanobacterium CCP5]
MQVKICGITRVDQAIAIAHAGATALGFICVRKSPRYIEPGAIAAITAQIHAQFDASIETVGVFANAELSTLEATAAQANLSGIQLHGSESPAFCQQVKVHSPGKRIIKALRIRDSADLDQVQTYAAVVDALLLDAYHPQMLGGTGQTLDWDSLESFRPGCPWLLAGGLNPDNIAVALTRLAPDGIDLSSGLEVSPGIKDLQRVEQLFRVLKGCNRQNLADVQTC